MGEARDNRDSRLEAFAAVILSITAVFIAWSSFQGTTWAGEAASLGREAGAARTESAKDLSRLNQDLISDQVLFSSFVLALGAGDDASVRTIAAEFRPAFAVLVEEWLTAGPGAPSPFDDESYTVRDEIAAAIENTQTAENRAQEAVVATDQRNDYAAATVVLALTLFLVGIGMTFKRAAIRIASLILGGVLLALAMVWILTFPVVV